MSPALQAADIDTTGAWNGTDYIWSFGVPNTATYGQTITATATENTLNSFSVYVDVQEGPVTFYGYVYEWNGTDRATGPQLYKSAAVVTLPQNPGVYETVTFNTGGLSLTPGKQYVLFASVSESYIGSSKVRWASVPDTTYTGGTFVFVNNSDNISGWMGSWSTSIGIDLSFKAVFYLPPPVAALPVPMFAGWGVTLLASLLAALAFFMSPLRRNTHK